MSASPTAVGSVVVAAHDEAEVIEDTLVALLVDAAPGELDVVVVCNGCRDDTAARARGVPGVRVVELPTASKPAALREGDRRTGVFPRIYLDADVRLTTAGARALFAALRRPTPAVAGLRADLELEGSSTLARAWARFHHSLPVFDTGVIGAGVYALNPAGHARIGTWPDVVGDDLFVLRSFAPAERILVRGHRARVTAPRDLGEVVRRGVRIRRGNRDLAATRPPEPPPDSGLLTALRAATTSPRRLGDALVFLLVAAVVRARALGTVDRGDWAAGSPT